MKTKSEVAAMYLNSLTAAKQDINDPEWREDLIDAVYVHRCNDFPNWESRERIAEIVDKEIFLTKTVRRVQQRRAA